MVHVSSHRRSLNRPQQNTGCYLFLPMPLTPPPQALGRDGRKEARVSCRRVSPVLIESQHGQGLIMTRADATETPVYDEEEEVSLSSP